MEGMSVVTPSRSTFTSDEALLVVLARLAYPVRWKSLALKLGAQPGHLCAVFRTTCDFLNERFAQPLSDIFAKLDPARVNAYTSAVHLKSGTQNHNCIGFTDGEFLKHCRPQKNQRDSYNGHYRSALTRS